MWWIGLNQREYKYCRILIWQIAEFDVAMPWIWWLSWNWQLWTRACFFQEYVWNLCQSSARESLILSCTEREPKTSLGKRKLSEQQEGSIAMRGRLQVRKEMTYIGVFKFGGWLGSLPNHQIYFLAKFSSYTVVPPLYVKNEVLCRLSKIICMYRTCSNYLNSQK